MATTPYNIYCANNCYLAGFKITEYLKTHKKHITGKYDPHTFY